MRPLLVLAVVAALAPRMARADSGPPSPAPGCPCPPSPGDAERIDRLGARVEHAFPTDVEGGRGTVSATRVGADVVAGIWLRDTLRLRLRFGAEESVYDVSDPDAWIAGDGPVIDQGHVARFSPLLEYRRPDGFGAAVGPLIRSAGTPDADVEETLTWGLEGSVRFPFRGHSLSLGARAETRFDGSIGWVPIIGMEGGGTGRWSVEARGVGVRVGYEVVPGLTVGVAGRHDHHEFRLGDEERVPHGVFRDQKWAGGIDVGWKRRGVAVTAMLWRNVGTELELEDRHDDLVARFDADDSWQVGLWAEIDL